MPESLAPSTVEELQESLRTCGDAERSVEVGGSFSKRWLGGPVAPPQRRLATSGLDRLLAYEPADLTVSVEAGMRYAELSRLLAVNNQCLPLDPPCADAATIGGILASNTSGPRRRRYGTARDMTIGMRFATLEGRLVSSGGMVVKNVTGLDMGKLMIGSFGTLAVIASANFKVFPRPESSETFVFRSGSAEGILAVRRLVLGGVLQPTAIDWLDPRAAPAVGVDGAHALLAEAAGSRAAARRFGAAFEDFAAQAGVAVDPADAQVWERVRECVPQWLAARPDGAAIRVSAVPTRFGEALAIADACGCGAVLRAGNAAGHLLAPDPDSARRVLAALRAANFRATLEAASDAVKASLAQWDAAGAELELMQRIKADFDPLQLLNRGRLYGVI